MRKFNSLIYMDSIEKKYYRIGEVAQILNIPTSTLRFWESQFTIIKPRRNDRGTRFYTPEDVEKIRMVYYLVKEKGLKLDAAQEQIRANRDGVARRFEAIERLKSVRERVKSLLDAANSVKV
ncbi:MAG: MerR family transcriptional regulator [Muribaculaceae bacterium]|nr:MerR family transcriptional regulator [Muribaculaceae bacterium]MBR5743818.1 MerR family transcriptional regulator [Muribaculaceae bacterium]